MQDGEPEIESAPSQRRVLGEKTMGIARLETENASLRAELASLRAGGAEQVQIAAPASNINSSERYEALTTKFNVLAKDHRSLIERHKKCDVRVAMANRKWAEAKEMARQWKAYVEEKQKKLPKTAVERIVVAEQATPTTPESLPDVQRSDDDQHDVPHDQEATPRPKPKDVATLELHFVNQRQGSGHEPGHIMEHAPGEANAGRSSSKTLRVTSSQTTDGGSDPAGVSSSLNKHDASSDFDPVVVSARSLKRKRSASIRPMPPPVRIKREENSPDRPISIKSEDFSSPVVGGRTFMLTETSDLDAMTASGVVPREPRLGQRAVSEEFARRQTPTLARKVSSLSDGGAGAEHHDVRGLSDGPGTMDQEYLEKAEGPDPALRPLSVNILGRLEPGNPPATSRRRRQRDDEAAAKALMLSEDGESQLAENCAPRSDAGAAPAKSAQNSKKRRLDSLLEEPTPGRERLVRIHSPDSAARRRRIPPVPQRVQDVPVPNGVGLNKRAMLACETALEPASPATTESLLQVVKAEKSTSANNQQVMPRPNVQTPHNKTKPASKPNSLSFKRPPGLEDSPPSTKPEDEPLRLRPLKALWLEDFRANPRYDDDAFLSRRCLPGCIKPACCGGTFIQAVQMGGYPGADDTESQVLEQFFGDNWQLIMGAYPKSKRDELVLEARAAAFANKFGKHRKAAAERHSTPPGFWRTEMPTTQQVAEDRAQAQVLAGKKVEERYREAMREGGRWLFRDE
ncbi:hypothetical protein LTR53_010852 [Teratosphaeriaceae sp. CCFEE 6253]|nr:hypothetical protein LTR53_010852 [Teratosphaeriaceae sp. CCFEE 6253]